MIDAFQLTSKNWSHRTTEKLKCSYRFRGVEKRSVNLSHCFRMKHRKVHEDDNIIEKPVPQAPDIRAIIKFAIPAIGIWLCGPLLSLIDTGAVGILSGTAQLAALNPAITITDDGSLLFVSEQCYMKEIPFIEKFGHLFSK